MVTDCGPSFTKIFLTFLNFIFFVSGSAILILGTWLALHKDSFIALTTYGLESQHVQIPDEVSTTIQELTQPLALEQLSRGLLALGGFIFAASVFGYCGASKESRFLLSLYSALITVILAGQVALCAVTAVYKYEIQNHGRQLLRQTLDKYYAVGESSDAVTLAWNFFMAEFQCCGVDNFTDFSASGRFLDTRRSRSQLLPAACCILDAEKYPPVFEPADINCLTAPTSYNSYFLKGCYNRVLSWMQSHLNPVLIFLILLATVEVIAVIFAVCLCKAIDRDLQRIK